MQHTFQITNNQTMSRTAVVKMLRKNRFWISGDYSVTTDSASDPCIQQMISAGALREKAGRRFDKKVRGRKTFQTPSAEIIRRKRNQKRDAEIEEIFRNFYRLACSSWAGGSNHFCIKGDSHSREACADTYRQWSSNGKWSGNSNRFTIAVEPEWTRKIENRGIAVLNNELTTHAFEIGQGVWLASWIKQGRGFQISSVHGLIVTDGQKFKKTIFDFKKADFILKATGLLKKLGSPFSEVFDRYDEKSVYFKIMLASAPEQVLAVAAEYEKHFLDNLVEQVLSTNSKTRCLPQAVSEAEV